MELKFRNLVTVLVVGILIGGAGLAIIYDGTANQNAVVLTEVTSPDGTFTKTFKDNSLGNSQIFNIWLGAVLSYGGAIIAVLYKAKSGSGEDP